MRAPCFAIFLFAALLLSELPQRVTARNLNERSLEDVRNHMSDLGQRLNKMRQNMRDRLKQIAAKTASISARSVLNIPVGNTFDCYGPYQELLLQDGATVFMVNNGSSRSRRPRVWTEEGIRLIPASYEPIDLRNITEGKCFNMTMLNSVEFQVCGDAGNCRNVTTPAQYIRSCPSSYTSWCLHCYPG